MVTLLLFLAQFLAGALFGYNCMEILFGSPNWVNYLLALMGAGIILLSVVD